jgi:hypothetical protein
MKRQKLAITVGTAALLLTGTAAYASTADTATAHHRTVSAEPTKKQILALFDRWNATLATGDAD